LAFSNNDQRPIKYFDALRKKVLILDKRFILDKQTFRLLQAYLIEGEIIGVPQLTGYSTDG